MTRFPYLCLGGGKLLVLHGCRPTTTLVKAEYFLTSLIRQVGLPGCLVAVLPVSACESLGPDRFMEVAGPREDQKLRNCGSIGLGLSGRIRGP